MPSKGESWLAFTRDQLCVYVNVVTRICSIGEHLKRIISKLSSTAANLQRHQKVAIFLGVDVVLVPISLWLTKFVAGEGYSSIIAEYLLVFLLLTVSLAAFGGSLSWFLGLPKLKLNAYDQHGIHRTAIYAVGIGFVGFVILHLLFGDQISPRVMTIFTMILAILSVSARIIMRAALIILYRRGLSRQRVMIYGAGQAGVQLATVLHTDDSAVPVAFMDDNKTLHKVTVAGLPVFPPVRLETLIQEQQIDRIVLAMPSLSRPKQARLIRRMQDLKCEVSILPSFAAFLDKTSLLDRVQPVNAADYLGRDDLEGDLTTQCDIYIDRTVMITGAGGSIGSELTRQLLSCRPSKIVLFELSEFALYQLDRELIDLGVDRDKLTIVPVLGNVTDPLSIRRAITKHNVEIILHAAAYKHVPLVEQNPLEGLYNNVIGTRVVAEAARDATQVSHFILISTDKAVHPTNVMGASKRLAELLVQDIASRSDTTCFGIVRFGNVLGSSGSVIPLFEEQIARGGPVTLTHVDVTRYFMTLSEAARLVLLAGNFVGDSELRGDVFLLDMGEPVSIHKLAQQMIESAGYTVCDATVPDGDIEIAITGLRPGEKLHEELAMRNHVQSGTGHPKITRVEEVRLSELEAATALRALGKAIQDNDEDSAVGVVERWVGLVKKRHSFNVSNPSQNDIRAETAN